LVYACGDAQPSQHGREIRREAMGFPKIGLDLLEKLHFSSRVPGAGAGDGRPRQRQSVAYYRSERRRRADFRPFSPCGTLVEAIALARMADRGEPLSAPAEAQIHVARPQTFTTEAR
jgi:hypothetical protein